VLKAWIRRHQELAMIYAESGDFGAFLDEAVRAQGGNGHNKNLFRKSGIEVLDDDI